MEELRKPFFIAALLLFGLVVLIELGASIALGAGPADASRIVAAQCPSPVPSPTPPECDQGKVSAAIDQARSSGHPKPGLGIPYMALVDGVVLFNLLLIGSSLVVPLSIEARLQGFATLIFGVVVILLAIVLIFAAITVLTLMIAMLLSVPFGTIAYLAIYGFFDRGGAAATLSFIMLLKLVAGVCLFLAQQRFLQDLGLVVVVVASLVANVVVSFLQGLVPLFLVSITDAIAAIVVAIIAVILLILLLVGGITSVVKALSPTG